jgi:hypothetical protein
MEQVPQAFDEVKQELDSIKTEQFFSSIRRWNKNRKISKFHKTKSFYTYALGENEVCRNYKN